MVVGERLPARWTDLDASLTQLLLVQLQQLPGGTQKPVRAVRRDRDGQPHVGVHGLHARTGDPRGCLRGVDGVSLVMGVGPLENVVLRLGAAGPVVREELGMT